MLDFSDKFGYKINPETKFPLICNALKELGYKNFEHIDEGRYIFVYRDSVGWDNGTEYFDRHRNTLISVEEFIKLTTKTTDVEKVIDENSEKLSYIDKWLKGEKIQYHLGTFVDGKSQWHNLNEKALQYLKRSDMKFRVAPKYLTINGVEFKSMDSLIKYVKNNYDLNE